MRLLFFLVCVLSIQNCRAEYPNRGISEQFLPQKIAAYMERYSDFSGAVLVGKKGEIIFSKGYGLANDELKVLNSPQTRFRIASLTKLFIAVAMMQLQERGLLNVQDTLSKYVPDYPNGDRITIHHLLTHTSGIPNYYKHFADVRFSANVKEMVAAFKKWSIEFEPGARFCYSNSGYAILAYINRKSVWQEI